MKSENRPNWDDILLTDRRIFPDHMNPAPTAEEEVIEPHLLRKSYKNVFAHPLWRPSPPSCLSYYKYIKYFSFLQDKFNKKQPHPYGAAVF